MERLGSFDTVMARLHQFRLMSEDMRDLEVDDLIRLLECLPAGWARRRALVGLLRSGIPEDLEDALALVEAMAKPSDRLWCWSALIDRRPLTSDEGQRLLAREDSLLVRRRLQLRMSRGRAIS
jgi:hypothetical protein